MMHFDPKSSTIARLSFSIAISCLLMCAAQAEPLVKMEAGSPKPGVVTAWKTDGDRVELTLRDGTDPAAVVAAIKKGVPQVQAKIKEGKVLVSGKPQPDLLNSLSTVDLGAGEEDLGSLAQTAMGGQEEGSGSSLRAKKVADANKLLADQTTVAVGKLSAVAPGTYPDVLLTLTVGRAPTGPLGKEIRKGATIKLKPVLKRKGDSPDWADPGTRLNLGGWYLKPGDIVRVKIGKQDAGTYEALAIERE